MSAVSSRPRIRSIVVQSATAGRTEIAANYELLAAGGTEHAARFTELLVASCQNASTAAGFGAATVQHVSPELVRLIATSAAGPQLVTELYLSPGQDPAMATEVVGLRDGTCQGVLDRFDQALEAEGVRSEAPTRRFTGGVCELAAARAFAARLIPKRLVEREENRAPATKQRTARKPQAPARSRVRR